MVQVAPFASFRLFPAFCKSHFLVLCQVVLGLSSSLHPEVSSSMHIFLLYFAVSVVYGQTSAKVCPLFIVQQVFFLSAILPHLKFYPTSAYKYLV